MKKPLLLVCALLLTSCIDVMNFGVYWNKGYVDPALAGMWEPVAVPGKDISQSSKQHVVVDGDAYRITNFERGVEKIDAPIAARLLLVTNHTFLMLGGQAQGALYRYKIEGNVVKFFELDKAAALKYVAEKHPRAANIEGLPGSGSYGSTFGVKTLDSETLQILVEIPDTEAYWKLDTSYKKAP